MSLVMEAFTTPLLRRRVGIAVVSSSVLLIFEVKDQLSGCAGRQPV